MTIIGACVYRSGGDVLAKLQLLKPHFIVVGEGAWNDAGSIAFACHPVKPLLIYRAMAGNLIDQNPTDVCARIIAGTRWAHYENVAVHLLNEQYNDVMKARAWELEAIGYCKSQGYKTVALNLSYGKDPDPRFKDVADEATYIGPHLYDGYEEDKQRFVDRNFTSRRYATNWLADYTHKYIATECGIESFPGTGQRRGWHDMGLTEKVTQNRMLANALEWKADGVNVCYFTLGHTEESWNTGYGMTEGMATAIGLNAPLPNLPNLPEPPDNGGDMTAEQKKKLEELILDVQRILGGQVQGNTELMLRKGADNVKAAFAKAGEAVNYLRTLPN